MLQIINSSKGNIIDVLDLDASCFALIQIPDSHFLSRLGTLTKFRNLSVLGSFFPPASDLLKSYYCELSSFVWRGFQFPWGFRFRFPCLV